VAFLAIVIAFFVVAAFVVIGCDRIIGSDSASPAPRAEADDKAAA
jgi:hypothetical protein